MTFSKLGTDNETGQIVELSQASRRQGLYIIGANGTGKTGLIEHLILQDIDQGLGVGLLDPHGDLVNAILAKMTKREDDVILLDIQDEDRPFGLNLFECPNPQSNAEVQKIVDLVMHIFEKLYDVSRQTPRMAQFLRNCTHTLVANPGYTMADIPLLLQDDQCRSKLVAQVKDPQVQLFWKTYNALRPSEQFDRAESTINKMDELLQPLPRNIVGQAKTTVNIQQVMDERKILLVKLSAQLDQVTSLVGTLFIALFLNAAYSRASLPVNKRKQFNLYADEFQRFATEDFATLLTEARKFGIATTIAHQARYQPGMTDGIRAVSLQAANHVVFRVTSPDADELAGGFDVSPQAAWEEEIEKEWVEVLKAEWYERVEEEVIDGEEEIKTPVKNVVHHLLNGGSHPTSAVVNQFATTILRFIEGRENTPRPSSYKPPHPKPMISLNGMNTIFYQAMITKNIYTAMPTGFLYPYVMGYHELVFEQDNWIWFNAYLMAEERISDELDLYIMSSSLNNQRVNDFYSSHYYDKVKQAEQAMSQLFDTLWTAPTDQAFNQAASNLLGWMNYAMQVQKEAYDKLIGGYHPSTDASVTLQAIEAIRACMQTLREVMQALAANPIEVGSGLVRPRKRKQINILTHPPQTLTHPRKVIMHPQRTYQDVKNDIANQLSGLQNFTARVKLSEIVSHNPGKKCLNCKHQSISGDKFCKKCGEKLPAPNEYTFTTLKPLGGLGKAALQQRLTTIQANNIQQRYVRDRTKVEAEIINRQQSCSGSAPAQPQKPQPQPQQPSPQQSPRHARQVPVQGKCSKCGKTNPPGSMFCNQCGTKL